MNGMFFGARNLKLYVKPLGSFRPQGFGSQQHPGAWGSGVQGLGTCELKLQVFRVYGRRVTNWRLCPRGSCWMVRSHDNPSQTIQKSWPVHHLPCYFGLRTTKLQVNRAPGKWILGRALLFGASQALITSIRDVAGSSMHASCAGLNNRPTFWARCS